MGVNTRYIYGCNLTMMLNHLMLTALKYSTMEWGLLLTKRVVGQVKYLIEQGDTWKDGLCKQALF